MLIISLPFIDSIEEKVTFLSVDVIQGSIYQLFNCEVFIFVTIVTDLI